MGSVRVRLSTLWVFVMFNMLAADVIAFLDGAFLQQLVAGHAGPVRITATVLLVAAILIEIPISMIVLSRALPDRLNGLANVAAAAFTALFVVAGGDLTKPHYLFFATIEVVALAFSGRRALNLSRGAATVAARAGETVG
jgi:hypothetical protein